MGNYESLDVHIEAALADDDNIQKCLQELEATVETYFSYRDHAKNYDGKVVSPPASVPAAAPAPHAQPAPKPAAQQEPNRVTPKSDILEAFAPDIACKLTAKLDDQGKVFLIRPRTFLGSETFREVVDTVKSLGGTYISAGKDSHFRVPVGGGS